MLYTTSVAHTFRYYISLNSLCYVICDSHVKLPTCKLVDCISHFYQHIISSSVGRLSGALSILVALGFREEESGSLILPTGANLRELDARRLELEVGLNLLRKRIEMEAEAELEKQTGGEGGTQLMDGSVVTSVGFSAKDVKKNMKIRGMGKGRMLPPRPTTAAAVASELAIAAAAAAVVSSNKKSDGLKSAVKIPTISKSDAFLQEEKLKRLKAETALAHQESLVHDLQSQISELQEIDQRNLTLRQGLTINRLEIEDRDGVKKEAKVLGKDCFAFHEEAVRRGSDVKPKAPNPVITTAKKERVDKSLLTAENQQQKQHQVSLTHPASVGDIRLHVTSQESYKKGMFVIIGSGMTAECRTISGFGSIIIDKPLVFSHPSGSILRVFPAIEKNILKIDIILAEEYVRGLLEEEIIPLAVSKGIKNIHDRELNVLYRQRAMIKHSYTLEKQDLIPVGVNKNSMSSLTVHALQGKIFTVSQSGSLSSLDFSWCAVQMLSLFEELASKHTQLAEGDLVCEKGDFLRHVERDENLRGVMQQLAESRGFVSFVSLMNGTTMETSLLSYAVYSSILQPSASRTPPIVSVIDRDILLTKYRVDSSCIESLLKVFALIDLDGDENITPSEARASFAQLDGCFTDFASFNKAMARVLGPHTEEQRLSAVSYITVRAEYATLTHTLPGGLLLHGRRCATALIDSLQPGHRSLAAVPISVTEVIRGLPPNVLDCTLLCSGKRISDVLADLPSPSTRDLVIGALTGRVLIGSSPRREESVFDCSKLDVVQISSSINGRCLHLLARDGVIHLFDVETSKLMLNRRIIWAEPPPQRTVEGHEKFLSWRIASGLDFHARPGVSEATAVAMLAKAKETVHTSSLLANFVLSLPSAVASSDGLAATLVAVDSETGLVAVNCSASSGSICIHEPVSLRRIYRIKAPGTISKDLSSAIQGISVGERFRGRQSPQMSEGLVSAMVLWARRSLLLCTLGASHDLHIISLLTGDIVVILAGHTDNLSCLSISCPTGLILTGALDGIVRVWIADECVPHRLAAVGTFDDLTLHSMEKKIVQPVGPALGTGIRQTLRNLSSQLASRIQLTPTWRRGKICSFFDGARHRREPHIEQHSVGVEIVFENGSVQIYTNRVLLRNPREIIRAPAGPPLWGETEAPLILGQEVAIYEIDPDIAACMCAREIGQPVMASQSYTQCIHLLNDLLDLTDENAANILEAVGLHKQSKISVFSLIRRIFKYHEKYSSRCDRLLAGNDAPVINITLSLVSRLLIAIDMKGICCIWDPCTYCVSLTISTPTGRPAFLGPFPYSLVQRRSILHEMRGAIIAGASLGSGCVKGKSAILSVISADVLSVPASMPPSFPVDRELLNKALSIDCKFSTSNVTVRGFIYVMRDLSIRCFKSSSFRPAFVAMDSPEHFMSLPRLSGGQGKKTLTKFQDLYLHRGDVLRIVYAVSCSHTTLDALSDDLRQYGVLQRGYTTTPSEQVEVVCFERPKGWLELTKYLGGTDRSLKETERIRSTGTGIIIASTNNSGLSVALDFSNDIIRIKSSQIRMVFDASNSYPGRLGDSDVVPTVGSRVQFFTETAADIAQPMGAFGERNVQDTLIVSLRCVDSDGTVSSSIVPLLTGRSSFPLPALEIDLPLCQDTGTALSHSLLGMSHTTMGRLSAHAYHIRSTRAAWMDTFSTHQMRVWDSLSMRNDKPEALLSMDVVGAFSGLNLSAAAFAADLFLSLSTLLVSPSHPLMVCLDSMLGGLGSALFRSFEGSQRGISGIIPESSLEEFQSLLRMRLGMLPEELCREANRMGTQDVESFVVSLYGALCNESFTGTSLERVGPITAATLSISLASKVLETRGGASNVILASKIEENHSLIVRLRGRKGMGVLTRYLLQHWLTQSLKGHTAAMIKVNQRAMSGLLGDLSAVSLPLLIAVKDAPILPAPTFEQIRLNFPSQVTLPSKGQYIVVGRKPFRTGLSPLLPGLKMEIVRGLEPHSISSRTDSDTVYSFLSWTYTHRESIELDEDPALLAAITQLVPLAAPLQQGPSIIVRNASGVGFTGETGRALSGTIYEWDDTWQPLSVLLDRHKGFFSKGRVDLFRLQATRLLDALIELHDSGVVLRGLSPNTVILDGTGTRVRILLLPIAYDMDKALDQTDSTNTIMNEGALMAYITNSRKDPLRLCCIPHNGSDASSALNLTGPQWDTWSFGSIIFMMAFGHSPLAGRALRSPQSISNGHSSDLSDQPDSSSAAASLLFCLMMPLLDANMKKKSGSKKRCKLSPSSPDLLRGIEAEEEQQVLIAESLQNVFDNQSRELLFYLLADISGQSMTHLSAFRIAFCLQAPVCGLTDRAASLLWEKMIQSLFSRLSGGPSSLLSMKMKLAKLPRDLDLPTAVSFCADHLGIVVTNKEFETLVTSLSGDLNQRQRPFRECAKRMFISLSGMLEEVQWYGLFQQVLYVTSSCLTTDPYQRPPLRDLRRLALFGMSENDLAQAKAAREAQILMAPYADAESFFCSTFLDPFSTDLLTLMTQTMPRSPCPPDSSDDEELIASMHSNLAKLTNLMGCIEDLVSVAAERANSRYQPIPQEEVDLGYFLNAHCLDRLWLSEKVVQILALVVESNMISGVALYVLRFISTDAAQRSSDVRLIGGIGRENEKESDTRGLSIGSRLIMRTAKFLQHLSVCLCSLSRDLELSSLLREQLKRVERDETVLNEFQSLIDLRKVAEDLYRSCLRGTIMLYTGEEAPVRAVGHYGTNLMEAHPKLFRSQHTSTLSKNVPLVDPLDVPMECRWSAHTCRLFEPTLLELVGEDGRGSQRLSLGGEMLSQADNVIDGLLTAVASASLSAASTGDQRVEDMVSGQGVESRGSAYFVGLLRICRALCAEELAGTGRAKERANLSVVTAMALSLPPIAPHTAAITEDGKATQRMTGVVTVVPDGVTWQRLFVLLDTRSALRIPAYFSSHEPGMKVALLKTCCRALSSFLQVPADVRLIDPYVSVGLGFTSECWILSISELLRVKVEDIDLVLNALECLRYMAQERDWMRCWAMFDILPVLCFLSRAAGKNLALIRSDAKEVLRLSAINRPEGIRAMVNLRMPYIREIPGASGPGSLSTLQAEAADMTFGSTLGEQAKFTESLWEWVSLSFPSEIPKSNGILDYKDNNVPWTPLLDLAVTVSSWIPKLCLTLQISDAQSTAKREKEILSVDVACKQILCVQRILLYACLSGHPDALPASITCIWAPPRDPEMALLLGNAEGTGLLSCLDQLSTAGIYVDTFLSVKLQFQIVRSLCQLMMYGSCELKNSFLDCGVVRSFSWFFQCVINTVNSVTRLNQLTVFCKEYRHFISTVNLAWDTLLYLALNDDRVVEEIIDSGIMQKLVEEWLPCTQCVTLILSADVLYNPLMVRSMALTMLRGVLIPRGIKKMTETLAGTGETEDIDSDSHRLASEMTRWLMSSGAVQRELMTIRSTVTATTVSHKSKSISANIAANGRRTAADVLTTLAGASLERIDQELKVRTDFPS